MILSGAHSYRTWEADGGWYAEGVYAPTYPAQLSYGSTEEQAMANLAKRFLVWIA